MLASAQGREAEQIIRIAREAGVVVMEDSALALILGGVKPGDYVPPQCWETVAKILAFIFQKESEA